MQTYRIYFKSMVIFHQLELSLIVKQVDLKAMVLSKWKIA